MATGGNENRSGEPDKDSGENFGPPLSNLPSRELVELWRTGSQAAASILWARYEVRLVALVAARLSCRLRNRICPEDVVQSALGSFFRVTQAGAQRPLALDSTASAWNILAAFVRRKLARAVEREAAFKRGGGWLRTPLDDVANQAAIPSDSNADELLADLQSWLTSEQTELLQLMLDGFTQQEIAAQWQVDERTIRRRIAALRTAIAKNWDEADVSTGSATAISPPITLPRMTYGQFVLGQLVARGASGKVYRARLQADDQVVAVKFMHRHLWADPTSRLLFLREIDHAAGIQHPGIVRYLGWGFSPHGGPYLVTEYIDGHSLAHAPPHDPTSAVQWLFQICQAIDGAHRQGVVHGDLTPNNVLLAHDGRIVITDFGLATRLQASSNASTEPTAALHRGGTLGFAAPEQISPAFGQICPATDIFAIGGLAYYLLTGQPPYDSTSGGLSVMVTDEEIVVPVPTRSRVETILARVATLALKKAVVDRPTSVAPLIAILAT